MAGKDFLKLWDATNLVIFMVWLFRVIGFLIAIFGTCVILIPIHTDTVRGRAAHLIIHVTCLLCMTLIATKVKEHVEQLQKVLEDLLMQDSDEDG